MAILGLSTSIKTNYINPNQTQKMPLAILDEKPREIGKPNSILTPIEAQEKSDGQASQ